ncbi:unnamed protein product [Ambrosiozyma monospora]|uniref:Unnamed protein product n=1 Tax=Ambrosiozyma monospora TaxID=43982 RepID=A0ACB5SU95_AMBMO|nr:unnamed protein product [Ambrosiozyma monospora]
MSSNPSTPESTTGRKRKVKCDENKPNCHSCIRNNYVCVWPSGDQSLPHRNTFKLQKVHDSPIVFVYGKNARESIKKQHEEKIKKQATEFRLLQKQQAQEQLQLQQQQQYHHHHHHHQHQQPQQFQQSNFHQQQKLNEQAIKPLGVCIQEVFNFSKITDERSDSGISQFSTDCQAEQLDYPSPSSLPIEFFSPPTATPVNVNLFQSPRTMSASATFSHTGNGNQHPIASANRSHSYAGHPHYQQQYTHTPQAVYAEVQQSDYFNTFEKRSSYQPYYDSNLSQ